MRQEWTNNYNQRPAWVGDPRAIVLHATGGGTLESVINWFKKEQGQDSVSSHYVIGKSGEVVQMVRDEHRAWHAGASVHRGITNVNDFSLGIELVNANDGIDPYPVAQTQAAVNLMAQLMEKYGIPASDIVSHQETSERYTGKYDPKGLDMNEVRLAMEQFVPSAPPLHKPPYIFGLHEPGGEHLMETHKGWILFLCALGHEPNDNSSMGFTHWSGQGYGVIGRLQHGWGDAGTIPLPEHYGAYITRVTSFVEYSEGCHVWILGNELNHQQEWPQGQKPDLDSYVWLYTKVRESIKKLPGHYYDEVLPFPVAPWNPSMGDWVYLQSSLLAKIERRSGPADGIAIHAYTHGHDPALVTSNATMDPPYENRRYNFMVYADFLHAVPLDQRHLPVYITEIDADDPWMNVDNGFCQAVLDEVNGWNQDGKQTIISAIFYRWPCYDKWSIKDKPNLHQDLRKAAQKGYTWTLQVPDDDDDDDDQEVPMIRIAHDSFNGNYPPRNDPLTGEQNVSELKVPEGWTAVWKWSPNEPGIHHRPEYAPRESGDHVLEGKTVGIHVSKATMDTVMYRKFTVPVGATIRAIIEAMGDSEQCNHGIVLGIDPLGGEDGWAPTVAWGDWYAQNQGSFTPWENRKWVTLSAEAVAQSNRITVFVRTVNEFRNDAAAHVDEFQLFADQDVDPPGPTPTPTPTPPVDGFQADLLEDIDAISAQLSVLRGKVEALDQLAVSAIVLKE